ncbi:uncharacterized protein KRP23_277 [Phytophthora ramorum]|uniref:uncharacterized protein n=1 Tax=Phytophthora ramorum TaxID=164328 RepID=UPI00309F38AA|nr:hypothetical protein KRP23_277 [Phytophthora ramorum]
MLAKTTRAVDRSPFKKDHGLPTSAPYSKGVASCYGLAAVLKPLTLSAKKSLSPRLLSLAVLMPMSSLRRPSESTDDPSTSIKMFTMVGCDHQRSRAVSQRPQIMASRDQQRATIITETTSLDTNTDDSCEGV